MQDFIAKGTGNSRYLRSSLPAGTSWEEALALLGAGSFPIDLAGFNPAGVAQEGTLLSSGNLLSESTAAALGLPGDPTVDDALAKLKEGLEECAPLASPVFTGTPQAPASATDYTAYRLRNMALRSSEPSGAIGNGQLVGVYE